MLLVRATEHSIRQTESYPKGQGDVVYGPYRNLHQGFLNFLERKALQGDSPVGFSWKDFKVSRVASLGYEA